MHYVSLGSICLSFKNQKRTISAITSPLVQSIRGQASVNKVIQSFVGVKRYSTLHTRFPIRCSL